MCRHAPSVSCPFTFWIGCNSLDEAGDDALVTQARHDRQAFAPLYARYLSPVFQYCYRRLGSQEAAEDATSIVFMRALAALHSYQPGSFKAWLFTIAYHVVVDTVRQQRPEAGLEAAGDPVDSALTPEEQAVAAERRHELLSSLLPDQRSVVELRLAGLTGAEIAAVMGRSHGAVKMLQLRAVERLRGLVRMEQAGEEADHGRA